MDEIRPMGHSWCYQLRWRRMNLYRRRTKSYFVVYYFVAIQLHRFDDKLPIPVDVADLKASDIKG